jgi:Peptidase C39 family
LSKNRTSQSRREFLAQSALVFSLVAGGSRAFAQDSDSNAQIDAGSRVLVDPRLETSLLNDDMRLKVEVSKSQYVEWLTELGKPETKKTPRRAALLEMWAGEYELAVLDEPATAAERFLRAQKLTKSEDPLYGWAVYNVAIAHWLSSKWEASAMAFNEALRGHKGRLCGFDRRLAALWLKKSKARLAEFETIGKLGIPRHTSLDKYCGAASLAICLEVQGIENNKKKVFDTIKMTGRGSSSADIVEAAKKLGAVAHEMMAPSNEALIALPKPLIAYVERDHFVTVESADKDGVVYRCNEESGQWADRSVPLTWAQWKAMTPGYYICISRPNSTEDRVLTMALDKPESFRNGLNIASTGSHLGLSALYISMLGLFNNKNNHKVSQQTDPPLGAVRIRRGSSGFVQLGSSGTTSSSETTMSQDVAETISFVSPQKIRHHTDFLTCYLL